MAPSAVIVVGEAVVDITIDGPAAAGGGLAMTGHAGGSPANVAVGLARLGVRSRFAGRISGEGLGPFLRAHLGDSGVDLELCVDAPQPATAAVVGVDEAGSASYAFYVQGTADWQWEASELPRVEPGTAIHTGSLAIALAPGGQIVADWIADQRTRNDAFVSLDPNVRPVLVLDLPGYRERLDALVDLAQLVKVSDEDLLALHPGRDPLEIASEWARRGPELVVVTHGAQGATALAGDAKPLRCEATPVDVVDTIGAGDAFMAGLLAFLCEHDALRPGAVGQLEAATLEGALRFAGRVAAMTCGRAGADPPTRGEVAAEPRG